MHKCPFCNNSRTHKDGFKNNIQQYRCKNCGRRSTINTKTRVQLNVKCPHCHGVNIVRGGHLKSGSKRYICKDCGKNFSENTTGGFVETACVNCGSHHLVKVGTSSVGSQRWMCKECGKRFTENPLSTKLPKVYSFQCPKCGTKKLIKQGKTSTGKQYWLCTKCGHKFLEKGNFTHLTQDTKELIISLLQSGWKKTEIASRLAISNSTVCRVTKGHKLIWQEQRKQTTIEKKQQLLKHLEVRKQLLETKRIENEIYKQVKKELKEQKRLEKERLEKEKLERKAERVRNQMKKDDNEVLQRVQYTNKLLAKIEEIDNASQEKARAASLQYINGNLNKAGLYSLVKELLETHKREQRIKEDLERQERQERMTIANQALVKIQTSGFDRFINQARDLALDFVNQKLDQDAFAEILDDIYKKIEAQNKKKLKKEKKETTKVTVDEIKESPVLAKKTKKIIVKNKKGSKPKETEVVKSVEKVEPKIEMPIQEVKPKKRVLTKEELEIKQIREERIIRLKKEEQRRIEAEKQEKKKEIERKVEPLKAKCLAYELDEQLIQLQELQADYLKTTDEQLQEINNQIEELVQAQTTDRMRENLVQEILRGTPLDVIVEQTKYDKETIYDIAKGLVTKETITPQQEKLIILYGVMYKSNVLELLKHVKCSELKCREVIANYEQRLANGENIWKETSKKKK